MHGHPKAPAIESTRTVYLHLCIKLVCTSTLFQVKIASLVLKAQAELASGKAGLQIACRCTVRPGEAFGKPGDDSRPSASARPGQIGPGRRTTACSRAWLATKKA